ncbi:DUF4870 domain-containing protein [Knoellia sp. CPCC 206435]|uniref:DUF4870 domain-containing protein n=1 Tax=Knoellia terrae TaxID=3404797 RepID=UPI003B437D9E
MTTPHPENPQGHIPPQPPEGQLPPPSAQLPYPQTASGQGYPAPTQGYGPQVLDPAQQRQWGMFSHLIGVAAMVFSAGLLGFVSTLAVFLLYRERGDFVRRHAANSVNVQITMGVLTIVGIIFCLTVIGLVVGIPLIIAAWGWAFVVHILGAIKANNGEIWDPPLTPRFVK